MVVDEPRAYSIGENRQRLHYKQELLRCVNAAAALVLADDIGKLMLPLLKDTASACHTAVCGIELHMVERKDIHQQKGTAGQFEKFVITSNSNSYITARSLILASFLYMKQL